MPGLINIATTPPDSVDALAPNKTAAAKSYGMDPTLGTVALDTDTVSGQLDKILSKDTPFAQRSNARVAEAFNARGLINSSMAAGAAEAARIDTALPIAQQDASTFTQQRLANQQVSNAADQFNADVANKTSLVNADATNQLGRLKEQGTIETGLQELRGNQQFDIATLQSNTQKYLGEIEASYKNLVQTNDSAGKLYQQVVDATNAILTSGDLDADAKQSAIDKQMTLLQSGLTIMGEVGNIDIASLLDFSRLTA